MRRSTPGVVGRERLATGRPRSLAGRLLAALLAALLGVAGAVALSAVGPAPAAHAAPCSGPGKVTVVVDFKQLGGGVTAGCVSAGGSARSMFSAAGYSLTDVQRQPGFVCRVSGKPAGASCTNTPPTNAYWGLFWSKGNGRWTYSSLGAGSLRVPDGGYVAFTWQGSNGRSLPGLAPVDRGPTQPSSDPEPSDQPSQQPSPTATATTTTPTPSATTTAPSATVTPDEPGETKPGKADKAEKKKRADKKGDRRADRRKRHRSDRQDETVAVSDVGDPPADAGASASGDDGVPLWIIGVVGGLLLAGTGAVVALRRRSTG